MTASEIRNEIAALLEGLHGVASVDKEPPRIFWHETETPDNPSPTIVRLTNGATIRIEVTTQGDASREVVR